MADLNQIPQQPEAPIEQPQSEGINVVNPDGDLVSIPQEQLQEALTLGYRQPHPKETEKFEKEQTYGSLPQQALTAAEGISQGVLGPLAPAAEKDIFGVKPEDILAREEVNPISHYAGEIGGIAGSLGTGYGEAALAEKAGVLGAKALGLAGGESAIAKIGSAAAKSAIENALISAGDETSHAILDDPNQTAESALMSVGLGGLIGGSLGAVSPLWKATAGAKLGTALDSIQKRMGGIEGMTSDEINDAIQASGIKIAPEVKAALSDDPHLRNSFQVLQESASHSGEKAQEALKSFKNDISNSILDSFDRTPEDLGEITSKSDFDTGNELKKAITDQIKETVEPLADKFEKIKTKYKAEELPQLIKDQISDSIGKLTSEEGYSLSPSSPQAKVINNTMKELGNLKTLEDVRKYQNIIGDSTYNNPELRRVGGQLKGILRKAEDDTIQQAAGRISPDLVGEHLAARESYRNAMNIIDALNDRLHVGSYNGPESFLKALKEMTPEDVLRRLNPKGDAGLIADLMTHFPQAADIVKGNAIDQVLKVAASRAAPYETLNSKALFSALDKMSPEMKNFAVPMEAEKKLSALNQLLEGLPSKLNTSGTAKAMDSLWGHVPGTAVGLITAIAGHNPAVAFLASHLTKLLARDAPDALRLAMLKFAGSSRPIEAEGFKSMFEYMHNTIQGETLAARAAKNVFRAEGDVLPQSFKPKASDRSKLEKLLKAVKMSPQHLMDVTNKIGSYMPEHATALTQVAANASNYLNSINPDKDKQLPFDVRRPASQLQKSEFEKALDIAIQPLTVMDKIHKGNLTPSDVSAISNMYPGVYNNLKQKITNEMAEHASKNKEVPYKKRMSLSLFLGQPLDSSLTPQSIQSCQMPQSAGASQQSATQPAVGEPKPKAKHSMNALNKMPGLFQTKDQQREEKSNR